MFTFFAILTISFIISVNSQDRNIPFSTNSGKECKTECIDKGFSFCPLTDVGLCCEAEKCGMDNCSHMNTNNGAEYLACSHNDFCGDRVYEGLLTETQVITLVDPEFSASNLCVYEFNQGTDATEGDILRIDIAALDDTDIYWAEGTSWLDAEGRHVKSPNSASFYVRYPNTFFLTLVNTQTDLSSYEQITITYW